MVDRIQSVNKDFSLKSVCYSEDVKEILSLARQIAKKNQLTHVSGGAYFAAFLMTHRKFNRLDGLLKEMGLSSKQLKKALFKSTDPPPSDESLAISQQALSVLDVMEQVASEASHKKDPVCVEVEHLFKAISLSPDATVTEVCKRFNITGQRIDSATTLMKKKSLQRSILFVGKELIEVMAFVLFFLVMIKSFLGELRLIPSESMVPGLQIEDRLVIERVSQWSRPYQRGDILVFYPPMTTLKMDPWSLFLRLTGFSGIIYQKDDNIDVAYIKRLIALPGETVWVRPGEGVYVNGKKLKEPYVKELANSCTLVQPIPVCGPVTVPKGAYYMMGDNRNLSLDSRYWGFAKTERVIGRAVFRIWPVQRVGLLE
jgi:signal peptidase I